MAANSAEICRVCNLEPVFQQVTFVQIYWSFYSIDNFKFVKKGKTYYLIKKAKLL